MLQAMTQLSGASERSSALFTEGWAWREQLQRAMDGCHTTDDMSARSLAQYEEFEGPNIPLPCGYQVTQLVGIKSDICCKLSNGVAGGPCAAVAIMYSKQGPNVLEVWIQAPPGDMYLIYVYIYI